MVVKEPNRWYQGVN